VNEANEAISSWESSCSELETRIGELERALQTATDRLTQVKIRLSSDDESSLIATLEGLVNERQTAMQDRGALHAELDAQNEKAEKFERQIADLKANIQYLMAASDRLEGELEDERQSSSELREEVDRFDRRHKETVESEKKAREELDASKSVYEQLRKKLEEDSQSNKKELEEVQEQLRISQQDRKRALETLQSKGREQLEQERDRLTVVIAKLEEELREANDMVQVYVTDGASDKATEIAAQGLRVEIEDLRQQVKANRELLLREKSAREEAELEVERLKSDLAILVSLNDQEDLVNEAQMLSVKAAEKHARKDRSEIEQLRKSLHRAIDELELARTAEKEANEKLSKVRLQASVSEQDIVAAKYELNFMAQTMDEMRETESSIRSSFEYRIRSLENEHDSLRRYHSAEIESLRSDLAQVTMEKDRMIQSLKEAEKTNASLILASKTEANEGGDYVDLQTENSRLLVENAHLLTVASDDKARAERRLREMLGAQASSAEADVILERELRIAAEATVQTLKFEMEELRNKNTTKDDFGFTLDEDDLPRPIAKVESLAAELTKLKGKVHKLKQEKVTLKSELEQAITKAKAEKDALTEECRKAQAKAHKLEREGRFEAAVKSEVSRIQMSPGMSSTSPARPRLQDPSENDEWQLVGMPLRPSDASNLAGAGAYDYIVKQKEAIKEERAMYLELLSEHDSLLALLAQTEEERTCLRDALAKCVGQEAVYAVIQGAEASSLARYGIFIRTP
jgi:uncharacterized protein YgiM (DUF1202 family)